jgi:hypothetical protein
VIRRLHLALCSALLLGAFVPAVVLAQTPPPPTFQTGSAQPVTGASNLWLVAGGAFATVRGDCQTCEEDYPHRKAGSVLANIGRRVNARMDVGAEVFWVPMNTADGRIRTTHIDGVAQFRPWASQGFFLKGGAGMAFVRNWVDYLGSDAINGKALSVVIGAGWAFRPTERFGLQLFGAQHVAGVGAVATAEGDIPDVVGNFWSVGAAIVIR